MTEQSRDQISPRPSSVWGNKYLRLALIAGAIVALDQITKALVIAHLPLYESRIVIPGFFNLTHVQNPGGAFGLMAGASPHVRYLLFIAFSCFAVGLIFYFYRSTPATYPVLAAGLSLLMGGAIGNLIDRFRFGQVVDFLDLYVGEYHWPAFNVADSAVSVGMIVFAYHLLFKKMPE